MVCVWSCAMQRHLAANVVESATWSEAHCKWKMQRSPEQIIAYFASSAVTFMRHFEHVSAPRATRAAAEMAFTGSSSVLTPPPWPSSLGADIFTAVCSWGTCTRQESGAAESVSPWGRGM